MCKHVQLQGSQGQGKEMMRPSSTSFKNAEHFCKRLQRMRFARVLRHGIPSSIVAPQQQR